VKSTASHARAPFALGEAEVAAMTGACAGAAIPGADYNFKTYR